MAESRARAGGTVLANAGNRTISLQPGWNAVGFQCPEVSELTESPQVPGLAYYDGTTYQTAAFTLAEVNAGAAGRRGLWLFATVATNVSYVGPRDTVGSVNLTNGWNLIALADPGPVPGANLTTQVGGQPRPLNSVLFPTFYEVGASGATTPVDVRTGGVLQGGRAYWVYCLGGATLHWPLTPAATSLNILTLPTTVSADSASNASLTFGATAEVLDQFGARFPTNANVSLVTLPNTTVLGGNTTVAAVNGLATFGNLSLGQAGNVTLRARSAGLNDSPGNVVQVTPGAATELAFVQQPANGTAGVPLNPPVRAAFRDAQGNTVIPAPAVTVSLASSMHNFTLANNTADTDANGVASFLDLNQSWAANGYTLTASGNLSGTPFTSAPSNSFNIVPGSASRAEFTFVPGNPPTSGNASALTVEVQDNSGNRITDYVGCITVAIQTAPAVPNTASLNCTELKTSLAANATGGSASFVIQPNNAGAWNVTASADGVGGNDVWSFTVSPGAPAFLVWGQEPTDVAAGQPFSVSVVLKDGQLNVNPNPGGNVTLALAGPAGYLGDQTTRPANQATFADLFVTAASRRCRLQATYSDSPITSPYSAYFDVSPEVATMGSGESSGNPGHNLLDADGTCLLFSSTTPIGDDTNLARDIFLKSRLTDGLVTRLSVSSAGGQANGSSFQPAMSADGRYVVFASLASNLVDGDTNGVTDIFLRDRMTNTTTRVSLPQGGGEANAECSDPDISADGRFVVWTSSATNLVAGDTNGALDIFVRDLWFPQTSRVSVMSNGAQGGAGLNSYTARLSGDGNYVAFASHASLAPGDANGSAPDVYVRNLFNPATEMVSVSSSEAGANDTCVRPSISADGRFVAFDGLATNLVAAGTVSGFDVFLRDRTAGTTQLISLSTAGLSADGESLEPAISADGRYVAFSSVSTNLASGDTATRDIFVRDTQNHTTKKVSVGTGGSAANALCTGPCISRDGSLFLFDSPASNLVPWNVNGAGYDLFTVVLP